jgi:glucosamine--fructose-6-phosphate aminotransferase (isomerizing)
MKPTVMFEEIQQQPEVVRRSLESFAPLVEHVRQLGEGRSQTLIFARGSSDNAAAYALYTLPVLAGRMTSLGSPSLATTYDTHPDLSSTLCVVISQSGRTEEMVQSARWASNCGARVIAITNDSTSPLVEAVDLPIVTNAGDERAVPATKTYLAQVAVLAAVTAAFAGSEHMQAEVESLPTVIAGALERVAEARAVGLALADHQSCAVISRGFATGAAREVALKLQEAALMPALGMSRADFAHGPKALLGEGFPLLVLEPRGDDRVHAELAQLVAWSAQRSIPVFTLGSDDLTDGTCGWLAPFSLAVLGQMVAESVAVARGLDPDGPRHLTKITQT